jgi:hypothetical protein
MKFPVILLALAVLATAADKKPVSELFAKPTNKTVTKQVAVAKAPAKQADASHPKQLKTVIVDSVKIALNDSAWVKTYDTLKVTNVYKDTSVLVKSDSSHGVKRDTLPIKIKK